MSTSPAEGEAAPRVPQPWDAERALTIDAARAELQVGCGPVGGSCARYSFASGGEIGIDGAEIDTASWSTSVAAAGTAFRSWCVLAHRLRVQVLQRQEGINQANTKMNAINMAGDASDHHCGD